MPDDALCDECGRPWDAAIKTPEEQAVIDAAVDLANEWRNAPVVAEVARLIAAVDALKEPTDG